MAIRELIRKKRDGGELAAEEILAIVEGAAEESIPDYQLSAFLMATYFQGMTRRETAWLTAAMAASGSRLDLSSISAPKVDKHSTGGIGDKVSLILGPIIASLGVAVPMIAGRGLGHTGGTVDKLESIPGFRTDLSLRSIEGQVADIGIAMAAATHAIVPADRKLYGLRDVTGTVESLPLITASILSKKLAEDLDALVMDIKVGRGAFMRRIEDACELAESLLEVSAANGLACRTLITRMDIPLGRRIGNWLEVCESVRVLRGEEEPPLLMEVLLWLSAACLQAAGVAPGREEGMEMARRAIADGSAYRKFLQLVERQGGDIRTLEAAHEPQPSEIILSDRAGYVADIDALRLGLSAIELGAGRRVVTDEIAPAAGIILYRHIGEPVDRGEPLCGVVERRPGTKANPEDLRRCFTIAPDAPAIPQMIIGEMDNAARNRT
jgi:pyrimidine-nucleoside phosphorylase